jgi:hypothetical protein
MPMGANQRVDARSGTQWFLWTNAKLLVGARMRYSMTQALFMPFTNTCLAAVVGRVLTRLSARARYAAPHPR